MKDDKETSNKFISDKPEYIFMNITIDLFFYSIIGFIFGSFVYLLWFNDNYMSVIKNVSNGHKFPSLIDLWPTIIYFLFMLAFYRLFQFILYDKIHQYLHEKYQNDADEDVREFYKYKVIMNIYKLILYSVSTILGIFALKNVEYFPKSLGGNGEITNIFKGNFPDLLLYEKTNLMHHYYYFNLAFTTFDFYLMLSQPLQSDFLLMVIHHFATKALIILSYTSNYMNIGLIVLFIHYASDVLSYIVRVVIHIKVHNSIQVISTLAFLLCFIYTRLYVYGGLILHSYYNIIFGWKFIDYFLVGMMILILIMNCFWILIISWKFIKYCFTKDIEELYKIKIKKKQT